MHINLARFVQATDLPSRFHSSSNQLYQGWRGQFFIYITAQCMCCMTFQKSSPSPHMFHSWSYNHTELLQFKSCHFGIAHFHTTSGALYWNFQKILMGKMEASDQGAEKKDVQYLENWLCINIDDFGTAFLWTHGTSGFTESCKHHIPTCLLLVRRHLTNPHTSLLQSHR